MSIRREIEVTRKGLPNPIDVTYGTNMLPVELVMTDFNIPSGATATVYVIGSNDELKKQSCSITNNAVSFTPEAGFFEVGKNVLQVEILSNGKQLSTFDVVVNCQRLVKDSKESVVVTFNRAKASGTITVNESAEKVQIHTGLNNIESIVVFEKSAPVSQRTHGWIESEAVSGCATYGNYLNYFRKGKFVEIDAGIATIKQYSADYPIAANDYNWVAYGY